MEKHAPVGACLVLSRCFQDYFQRDPPLAWRPACSSEVGVPLPAAVVVIGTIGKLDRLVQLDVAFALAGPVQHQGFMSIMPNRLLPG